MSFQNFRLQASPSQPTAANPPGHTHDAVVAPGALLHSVPLTAHHQGHDNHSIPPPSTSPDHPINPIPNLHHKPSSSTRQPAKAPYGSGDAEDGYTMVFESMAAFEAWREREEEEKMVEFVKGDTHGSKAVPPRFKDHTKLVCARHQRSGRKKYVKKYPDRQRKVPSRKLEGVGCPASISYKTYFETEEVRVMYNDNHSHAIGEENLPYTRRGRRMEVSRQKYKAGDEANDFTMTSVSPQQNDGNSDVRASTSGLQMAGNQAPSMQPQNHHVQPDMAMQHNAVPSAIAMLAPLPPQMQAAVTGQPEVSQERWDRLEVLFQSVRNHARNGFDYPGPSVAALESVLIRLYLESPVRGSGGNSGMSSNLGGAFGAG